MVFVAALAGQFLDANPLPMAVWSAGGFALGVLATLPLLAFLVVSVRIPWSPFQRVRETVDLVVGRFFRGAGWIEVAAISILAGLGEEMLFRGVAQTAIAHWIGGNTGAVFGIVAAAVLFGAGHAVHLPYFVMATLMGAYFGGLFLYCDNLLVPIVAHALYDFVAILYLRSRLLQNESAAPEETGD